MKTDSDDQQPDINTPKQTKSNDFFEQIKEEQRDMDINVFSKYFLCERPDIMAHILYDSKSQTNNYDKESLIYGSFDHLGDKPRGMPVGTNKKQIIKTLSILNQILDFNEQNQYGQRLKILTPSQLFSKLPIS